MSKNYAVIFERIGVNEENLFKLKVLDYVEGEEIVLKGKKVFVIDPKFKNDYIVEDENDEFYRFLSTRKQVRFMEDLGSIKSKYVYGSPANQELFEGILKLNIETEGEYTAEELEEDREILKSLYIEALREYDFYQGLSESSGELVTCIVRRSIQPKLVPMINLLDDVVYDEIGMDVPFEEEGKYRDVFSPLPERVNIRQAYDECRKYIISQDDHILSILGGIDDNITATIPEEKSNILVCGPTGVGKTAIFRKLSEIIGVPMIIENATQFTKSGYVGRDVDDVFEDLLQAAHGDLELAQRGIIVIDEIDKKAGGRDDTVSGVGVLQSLLKLLEGGDYYYETGSGLDKRIKKFNTLRTTIAFSGAFSGLSQLSSKRSVGFERTENIEKRNPYNMENLEKYGIPPEFFGRIQLLELLNELEEKDLRRILLEAKNNPYELFRNKMARYNTILKTDERFIDELVREAHKRKTGARGLYAVMKDIVKIAEAEVRMQDIYPRELILTPETVHDNKAYTLRKRYKNRRSDVIQ